MPGTQRVSRAKPQFRHKNVLTNSGDEPEFYRSKKLHLQDARAKRLFGCVSRRNVERRDQRRASVRRFNDFMLYLRNSTTHKGRLLSDVERFKAELAIKMSFPFLEFFLK